MRRPKQADIDAEIADLKAIKPKVRQFSMFGDNHHAAIDAQVEVLEKDPPEEEIHENADSEGWPDNIRDAAIEARHWLDGEFEYPHLVDAWKELVK